MKNEGKLEIFCGPMFSGKTEELLSRLQRFYYGKKPFLLFKIKKDNRYSEDSVVSHAKTKMTAINIETAMDIIHYTNANPEIKIIGIDEIQFLPTHDPETNAKLALDAFKLCKALKMRGYHILASGLDMDYKGDPFGVMANLLAIADNVVKKKAVCFKCGEDAGFSGKLTLSDNVEEIGEKDMYEALCYPHWLENIASRKKLKTPKE